jgi:Rhodopirellula transposase DDE domain
MSAQAANQPVVSVDTKKRELIGNYRKGGSAYQPKGDPTRGKVHAFEDEELGKIAPYGVYRTVHKYGNVQAAHFSDGFR